MSKSYFSRRDVENWVPEPAPSRGGACFLAKLFTTINGAMASLTGVLSVTKDEAYRPCLNKSERFFLWGQGLSIVEGDLDEALAYSKELHFRVLSLLVRLGTVVLQGRSRDPAPSLQVLAGICDDLRSLLDMAESMLQEPEPEEPIGPSSPTESEASVMGAIEVVEEMSVYVDCLLDLSAALDNPALDIQVEGPDEPLVQDAESFVVASEEAMIYCRKIRDRFEDLPKYLVERLAEASVFRAAALRELRLRPTKYAVLGSEDIAESLFSSTDHRATETTKSTAPSSSVFSSVPKPRAALPEFDDTISEATFASYSTAASFTNPARRRAPPMPEIQGDGFNCPICLLFVTNVRTRNEWK